MWTAIPPEARRTFCWVKKSNQPIIFNPDSAYSAYLRNTGYLTLHPIKTASDLLAGSTLKERFVMLFMIPIRFPQLARSRCFFCPSRSIFLKVSVVLLWQHQERSPHSRSISLLFGQASHTSTKGETEKVLGSWYQSARLMQDAVRPEALRGLGGWSGR